ncbi:MAG TPA: hypothetical protein VJR23_19660 [Candidatus Acidoferrales bacterium]|nr:hypothetical protein [Candidatus Acidoferrales bacterium]
MRFLVPVAFAIPFAVSLAVAQKAPAKSLQISSAKTAYFRNQTGNVAVGRNALIELNKWGRFRIVQDPKQADLILLLSLEEYRGPDSAGGQPGDFDDPDVSHIPKWDRQRQTRYAYLTIIDPNTGARLWSAEHVWGGLLTGFNNVGQRLVKKLEKQVKQ